MTLLTIYKLFSQEKVAKPKGDNIVDQQLASFDNYDICSDTMILQTLFMKNNFIFHFLWPNQLCNYSAAGNEMEKFQGPNMKHQSQQQGTCFNNFLGLY
jgi:hypothetical protein